MTEPIAERIARLEVENEACAEERKEHANELKDIRKVLNQATGMIKLMIVLWTIITGAAGLGLAKAWGGAAQNIPASHP